MSLPSASKTQRETILKSDFEALLSSAATHPSAKYVAEVAKTTSWCRLCMGPSSGPRCSGDTWPTDIVENTQPKNLQRLIMWFELSWYN